MCLFCIFVASIDSVINFRVRLEQWFSTRVPRVASRDSAETDQNSRGRNSNHISMQLQQYHCFAVSLPV